MSLDFLATISVISGLIYNHVIGLIGQITGREDKKLDKFGGREVFFIIITISSSCIMIAAMSRITSENNIYGTEEKLK